jgi:hypothetical protein
LPSSDDRVRDGLPRVRGQEGDTADVARMQSILSTLADILTSELAEVGGDTASADAPIEEMRSHIAQSIKSLEALLTPEPADGHSGVKEPPPPRRGAGSRPLALSSLTWAASPRRRSTPHLERGVHEGRLKKVAEDLRPRSRGELKPSHRADGDEESKAHGRGDRRDEAGHRPRSGSPGRDRGAAQKAALAPQYDNALSPERKATSSGCAPGCRRGEGRFASPTRRRVAFSPRPTSSPRSSRASCSTRPFARSRRSVARRARRSSSRSALRRAPRSVDGRHADAHGDAEPALRPRRDPDARALRPRPDLQLGP